MKVWSQLSPIEAVFYLSGLLEVDEYQVRRDHAQRGTPIFAVMHGLQTGVIRYDRRDPNEHWKTREEVLATRRGDCEDLATAVAAELNEAIHRPGLFGQANWGAPPLPPPPTPVTRPIPARMSYVGFDSNNLFGSFSPSRTEAIPVVYEARKGLYHVVVYDPHWGYLDPSVAGGMGKA